MKYAFILLTIFLTSMVAKAAESCSTEQTLDKVEEQKLISTDVPKHLKGATICVRLANAKESCVPAEKFKVVPRKQQYLVTKTSSSTVKSCSNTVDPRRNRLSLLGGEGPTGHLNRNGDNAPNYATVESDRGAIGGLQYQYLTPFLNNRLFIGGQVQSNKTGLLGAGIEF